MNYLTKSFVKDPNIVSRKIAGEVILVPIRNNVGDLKNIYTLNGVATRIWELIDGKRQPEDIKKVILEEYEIEEEEAEKDLLEFLSQLKEIKAIVASDV
ncbi:PqqD family protein [Candidatus Aerophobetes bacterium Ae_b3b]|nr:MAG: PqqD family protein [Candidatus Aerophobetes bacterium Ae_b3b]